MPKIPQKREAKKKAKEEPLEPVDREELHQRRISEFASREYDWQASQGLDPRDPAWNWLSREDAFEDEDWDCA